MDSDAVALLFMPPWEPVRLKPDRAVVIGRSPACDLPVPSGQVSRRHAWVHSERGDYFVSDLGSTNGTFVNGQRVRGARPLNSGDRIRIGDQDVTFCIMDPQGASPVSQESDEATLIFANAPTTLTPSTPDALQGDLSQLPAFAVLQVLEMGQKSGVLDIRQGTKTYRLWMDGGRPVHCETPGGTGLEAAFELANMTSGRFKFEGGIEAPEVTIVGSMPELLLEASRQFDEVAHAAEPALAAAASPHGIGIAQSTDDGHSGPIHGDVSGEVSPGDAA